MSEQITTFDPVDESRMSLMEHLIELRTRMIWIVGTLFACTLFALVFARPLLQFIVAPLGENGVQSLGPPDTIITVIKLSFVAGLGFSTPVLLYHVIAFVAPGLYPHEKRGLFLILPGVLLLFITGAAFAYFIMLPVATGFLQSFMGDIISQDWAVDRYINFITRIVFWIGIFFETPLIIAFLARTGFVSGPQLLSWWRQAVVIASIVAAVITPTVDPVNMTIAMIPLIVLYFLGVGLAYLLYRPRTPRDFSEDAEAES